jgi:hypothetical protein
MPRRRRNTRWRTRPSSRGPAWTEVVDGGLFLDEWDRLDARGRGDLLRKMGIKLRARYTGRQVKVTLHQNAPTVVAAGAPG